MLQRVSQKHAFEALGDFFRCSSNSLGSPKAAKVDKKVDKMGTWNQPCYPEGPECYRRVPETSKMEPARSQNGAKVITNMARETYVFHSLLAQIAHSGLLERSCNELS